MFYLIAFPLGLIFSLFFTPLARAIAVRYSFVDVPDGKRYHRSTVPLLGGVAVTASVLTASLLTHLLAVLPVEIAEVFVASGLLLSFALGIYDDRNGMKARWKLLGQFVCALVLVSGCYLGGWTEGKFLFPFLVLWVVAIMNATNFLDNMDGIASGVAGFASLAFALLLVFHGQRVGVIIAGATCGASLGFLRFNFPPARIFLGDAGSLPLGYLLGALSIIATGTASVQTIIPPLIVLGYPAFDIAFVTFIRIRENRRFYQGGKDHSSHRLSALLVSPRKTGLAIYLVCAALGGIALLVDGLEGAVLPLFVLAVLVASFFFLGVRLDRVKSETSPQKPTTK